MKIGYADNIDKGLKTARCKIENMHLILHLLGMVLCENKPGYVRKQKFTKAHKAWNTKKN